MSHRGHTHWTVPLRRKKEKKMCFVFCFLFQRLRPVWSLSQWGRSVHVGVCFYMSARVCVCVSEKTDYENL